MTPGEIVIVEWRDALPSSGEPNKRRPAVIVGSPRFFGSGLPLEIVVPLSGTASLAIAGASLRIDPSRKNGCTKTCYALSWAAQTVPHARISATRSHIAGDQLAEIRAQIAACVDAATA